MNDTQIQSKYKILIQFLYQQEVMLFLYGALGFPVSSILYAENAA
jgi:hypothetical protein